MACVYTYKGKDYSYAEFAAALHDGLLNELIADNVVSIDGIKYIAKVRPAEQGAEKPNMSSEYEGYTVVYKGDKGVIRKEGGKYIIESDNKIYEFDEADFNLDDYNITLPKESTPRRKYDISVIDENTANVDGSEYEIIRDAKGNTIALKGDGRTIRAEDAMVAVDIALSKMPTSVAEYESINNELESSGVSFDEISAIDNMLAQNMNDNVARVLDEGIDSAKESDFLQLELFIENAIKILDSNFKGSEYANSIKEQLVNIQRIADDEYDNRLKEKSIEQNKKEGIDKEKASAKKRLKQPKAPKKKAKEGGEEPTIGKSSDTFFNVVFNENLSDDESDRVLELFEEKTDSPEFYTSESVDIQDSLDEDVPKQDIVIKEDDNRPEAQMMAKLRVPIDFLFGKRVGIGMSDTLTTGEREVDVMDTKTGNISKAKVREEGGIGYTYKSLIDFLNGKKGEVYGWAAVRKQAGSSMISAAEKATKIKGRDLKDMYISKLNLTQEQISLLESKIPDNKEYGIVAIYKMGDDGIKSNEAYAREAFRLIDTKLNDKEKKMFFSLVKERLVNKVTWKFKSDYVKLIEKAKNFNELEDVLHGKDSVLPLDTKTSIIKAILSDEDIESKKNQVGKFLKDKGISYQSVSKNIEEPIMNGIGKGQIMTLIAIDPKAKVIKDKNRERHKNYPYGVPGFPIGLLEQTAQFHHLSPEMMDTFVKTATAYSQAEKSKEGKNIKLIIEKAEGSELIKVYEENKVGTKKVVQPAKDVNGKPIQGEDKNEIIDLIKKAGYSPRITSFQSASDGLFYAEEGSGAAKVLILDKKGNPISGKSIDELSNKLRKSGINISKDFRNQRYTQKINGTNFGNLLQKAKKGIINIYQDPKITAQQKLVKVLQKAFPGIVVESSIAEYESIQEEFREAKLLNKDGKAYGFIYQGRVFLDPVYLNNNTPIHEFGHVWNFVAKNYRPDIYNKGVSLIKDGKYQDFVLSSNQYVKVIKNIFGDKAIVKDKKSGKNIVNSEFSNYQEVLDYVYDEALAKAIGDKGELIVNESQRRNFTQWLSELYNALKNVFGFKGMSPEQIQNMNLSQFTDNVVKELLGGKEISSITSEEIARLSSKNIRALFQMEEGAMAESKKPIKTILETDQEIQEYIDGIRDLKDKESRDKLAKRLRDKKIKGALSAVDFGLTTTIYNGALEFMASQVEKGTKLGNAIANTLKWIDERMSGSKWNKGAFAKYVNDTYTIRMGGVDVDVVRDDTKETADIINGFYSDIEQRVLNQKAGSKSATDWLGIVGKGDEAVFTGVMAFLEGKDPNAMVSKQEILDYMKDNRISVVDVVKGGKSVLERRNELFDFQDQLEEQGDYAGVEAVERQIQNLSDDSMGGGATKYSQYQLEGEKSDYKEVLVVLPIKEPKIEPRKASDYSIKVENESEFTGQRDVIILKNGVESGRRYGTRATDEEIISNYIATRDAEDVKQKKKESQFKSTHFDEPNILVHLRMNTRTDATGKKVLFLEEIQSDWAQKGRKEGFDLTEKEVKDKFDQADAALTSVQKKIDAKYGKDWDSRGDIEDVLSKEDYSEYQKAASERAKWGNRFGKEYKTGTPTAPFVMDTNAWVKLALKVAAKEAVKQGADKIAWTTGEQQNERYDLSKQVDKIEITQKDIKGQKIDSYRAKLYKNGEIINDQDYISFKDLEPMFGKEIASKVSKGETIFEGENLKVGGKGMRDFYGDADNKGIVGRVAEAVFGVKIGEAEIETANINPSEGEIEALLEDEFGEGMTREEAIEYLKNDMTQSRQPSIKITPELRSEIEKGLPLFGSIEKKPIKTIQDATQKREITEGREREYTPTQEGREATEAGYRYSPERGGEIQEQEETENVRRFKEETSMTMSVVDVAMDMADKGVQDATSLEQLEESGIIKKECE